VKENLRRTIQGTSPNRMTPPEEAWGAYTQWLTRRLLPREAVGFTGVRPGSLNNWQSPIAAIAVAARLTASCPRAPATAATPASRQPRQRDVTRRVPSPDSAPSNVGWSPSALLAQPRWSSDARSRTEHPQATRAHQHPSERPVQVRAEVPAVEEHLVGSSRSVFMIVAS
jgi:hypothetical protein